MTDPAPTDLAAELEISTDDPAAEALAASGAAGECVAYVGCPAAGRLLRVRVATVKRMRLRVSCPDCGVVHETAKPMARELRAGEDAPELVEIPPTEPDEAPSKSRRNQVSDPDVIAAIPAADTPAKEIVPTLGYTDTKGLLRRLKMMNARAEKKGEPAPFLLTRVSFPERRTLEVMVRKSSGTL